MSSSHCKVAHAGVGSGDVKEVEPQFPRTLTSFRGHYAFTPTQAVMFDSDSALPSTSYSNLRLVAPTRASKSES